MVGRVATFEEHCSQVIKAHVHLLLISYHSLAIILVSASSSSYFTLTVLFRIHTLCIGSPFPAVHANWSLVSRSVNSSY